MQQQPQGQDAYPRFDQPAQPQAFPISHSNPYNQQQPAYIPPPQYGMPGQQSDPNFPQGKGLVSQAEVQEIDNQLSSGAYSCYNCWLYVIVVFSCLNFISSMKNMATGPYHIIFALEALVECLYGNVMVEALKKKNLQKAELGAKLAFTTCGLVVCRIIVDAFVSFQEAGSDILPFVAAIAIFCVIYYPLVIAIPATKIKGLLERREAALAQNSDVSSYNV